MRQGRKVVLSVVLIVLAGLVGCTSPSKITSEKSYFRVKTSDTNIAFVEIIGGNLRAAKTMEGLKQATDVRGRRISGGGGVEKGVLIQAAASFWRDRLLPVRK